MEVVTRYFTLVWELLSSVRVPGTDMTFAALYVGFFVALLGVAVFRTFLGIGRDQSERR